MSQTNLTRRDFSKLSLAAFGGAAAGLLAVGASPNAIRESSIGHSTESRMPAEESAKPERAMATMKKNREVA